MMFQVEAQQEQRRGSDTWEWQVIWYCWVPGKGRASGWRGGVGRCQTVKVLEAIRGPVGWAGLGAERGTPLLASVNKDLSCIKNCEVSNNKSIKMSLTTLTTVEF